MGRLKAQRTDHILNIFLLGLVLIAIRVWYLSVVQYGDHFEASRKPQRRTVIQPALRGTIRDRFNIPLAMNQIQYNVAVCYSDIRQIPSVTWEKDANGKRKRVLARKEYVEKLCHFLSEMLDLDALEIEDTIHGRASLFPHTSFVIKEDIPETLYYKLKMCEREWLGIQMQQGGRRVYPLGKCACDVVGHMGAISQRQYLEVAQEMEQLREYLTNREEGKIAFLPKGYDSPLAVRNRLRELEEKAYTINDQVGKCGVEASFDETLRGRSGRQIFEVDTRGNPLNALPGGRQTLGGQRLVLSLSAQLQQTAEELLASFEIFQDERDATREKERRTPWMRGGSIVAMDPKTGEVLALASTPRFDPNDFVSAHTLEKRREKVDQLSHWLENDRYLAGIWEGRVPLEREIFDSKANAYILERKFLSWESFLTEILPVKGSVRTALKKIDTFGKALAIIGAIEQLLTYSDHGSVRALIQMLYDDPSHRPIRGGLPIEDRRWIGEALASSGENALTLKLSLDPFLAPIRHNEDKVLFLDILRLFVPDEKLSEETLSVLQSLTLAELHELMQLAQRKRSEVLEVEKKRFEETEFQSWRQGQFTAFLREKRLLEKRMRRHPRPYTDYLQMERQKKFEDYWRIRETPALVAALAEEPYLLGELLNALPSESQKELLSFLRPFSKLNRPLWGSYPYLRSEGGIAYEKHLAGSFYPYGGFSFGRSQAYRTATPMGSIFKLIAAYAALKERFRDLKGNIEKLDDLNPLTLNDSIQPGAHILGYFQSGKAIKRHYKGGILPRSPSQKGMIDLRAAIERTSNLYFPIIASDFLPTPTYLKDVAEEFGFGARTGIDLPGEYGGNLPNDLAHNKTGLYAFSIGQHSLVVTPLQTAVMLSALANGGKVLKPQIVKLSAGKHPKAPNLELSKDYPYKSYLDALGISFPLFTQALQRDPKGFIHWNAPKVIREVEMPDPVREMLLQGMALVTRGTRGTARPSTIRSQHQTREAVSSYHRINKELYSKTGTAEILYKQTIDAETPPNLEKHVWFGTMSFHDAACKDPELVIVVYLRFAAAGNQGAPMAARLIEKWREIQ